MQNDGIYYSINIADEWSAKSADHSKKDMNFKKNENKKYQHCKKI